MFYRFQTKIIDPDSGRPTGILVAAAQLRDSNRISIEGESWLRDHLEYYNEHLKVPTCLEEWKNRRALSWFLSGSEMINLVWELVAFMEENDIFIDIDSEEKYKLDLQTIEFLIKDNDLKKEELKTIKTVLGLYLSYLRQSLLHANKMISNGRWF